MHISSWTWLALVVLLVACAGRPAPGADAWLAQQWVGRTETELVNAWGEPWARERTADGGSRVHYSVTDPSGAADDTVFEIDAHGRILTARRTSSPAMPAYDAANPYPSPRPRRP